jgi:PIN domain nuclease of toxin-antitoxin system
MKNGLVTVITCDTHVLIYWATDLEKLSPLAAEMLERGRVEGALGCADIVLWEVAMLVDKGRVVLPVSVNRFLEKTSQALRLAVVPISPAIAVRAQDTVFQHKDPADRLIAATAMELDAPLITADRKLAQVAGLRVLW